MYYITLDQANSLITHSCRATSETSRYSLFVQAVNHSLQMMKPLNVMLPRGHLRAPTLDILFARNDPLCPNVAYLDQLERTLKPNVVITSRAAMAQCVKMSNLKWNQLANIALGAPMNEQKFEWDQTLSTAEIRRTRQISSTTPISYNKAQSLAADCIIDLNAHGRPVELTTTAESTICQLDKLPPLLQTASYATQLLCRSAAVAWVINLIIIGEWIIEFWLITRLITHA